MKSGAESLDLRTAKKAFPEPAELALRALAYLSRDETRASRFLSLTGLEAADVHKLLADSGFHLAILDHIAGDEALLLEFVAAESLPPEAVGRARRALGGGET
jgi:hypothetical protein